MEPLKDIADKYKSAEPGNLTSISSNSQRIANRKDKELIDQVLETNQDVIEAGWERRHGKLIHLKGVGYYEMLAHKARTYGKNPKALMGSFVNKELKK